MGNLLPRNSRARHSLTDLIYGRALRHHYVRSGKITARAMDLINWPAIEKANKKLSANDSTCLTKFVSRFTATGKNMKR